MKQCQYTSLGVPPRGRWDACAQQSKHARRCTKSIGNGKAQGTHGADGAPEGVERLQLRTRLEVRRGLRLDDLQAGKRSQVGSYLVSNECWPTILIGHAIHAAIFNESKLYMDYTWNTNPKKLEARCTEIRETTAKTSRNFKNSKTRIPSNALRSLGCPRLQFFRIPSDSVRATSNAISVPDGNRVKQLAELGPQAAGRLASAKIDQYA